MADQQVVNPSPATRFRADADGCRRHRELMQNANLLRAFDMALLEYSWRMSATSKDANTAAANQYKFTGALEFLNLLRMFAETTAPMPSTRINDNLTQPVAAALQ